MDATPNPPATPTKPDAILVPPGYRPKSRSSDRLAAISADFKAMLGGGVVWSTVHNEDRMLTASPNPTVNFPNDHAMTGQPRYRWEDADGVKYGFKVEESAEETQS